MTHRLPTFRTGIPAVLLALAFAGCSSPGPRPAGAGGGERAPAAPRPPTVGDARVGKAGDLSARDREEFERAWTLFLTRDPLWPGARDSWLARGGGAPYVLAENLFRQFWLASRANARDEVSRVAVEAAKVGEPAVAYFTNAMVTDRWPLKEPVTMAVFNPDNPGKPLQKTFTHYDIDDVTRQHASYVLASIGEPAVPLLSSREVLGATLPSARRYAAYALGAIATDDAVAALGGMLRSSADWPDRGAAAKSLGFALRRNPAARPWLEEAARDPDDFVRKKAEEGLAGRTKIEF